MTPRSTRSARKPLSLAIGATVLLLASFALAADATPIDRASGQVSEALNALKDVKVGNPTGDEHLNKARAYLARAHAELLKAQAQGAQE
jgi:hypothetical protein